MPVLTKEPRRVRAFSALGGAYARYQRREDAVVHAEAEAPIWQQRMAPSALLVRQARDLAGRLEAVVYDEPEVDELDCG